MVEFELHFTLVEIELMGIGYGRVLGLSELIILVSFYTNVCFDGLN